MSNRGAAAGSGGSGLLIGGVGVVIAIVAAAMLLLRQNERPTEDELSGLVQPPSVETTAVQETQASEATAVEAPVTGASAAGDSAGATKEVTPEETATEDNSETRQQEVAQAETGLAEAPQDAPSIDEVRLDRDGVAVIAGRAEPGSTVDVIVDGDVVASAKADDSGSFAALGVVSPSQNARVLSLSADGQVSRDEVILTPLPTEPAETAEAATERSEGAEGAVASSSETTAQKAETASEQAETTEVAAAQAASTGDALTDTPQVNPKVPVETTQQTGGQAATEAPQIAMEAPQITSDTQAPAPAEPPRIALLKSTEEGVTLLPEAPAPPSQIVLDTIGYSDSGVVQLSGRASVEASQVRVYLNNRSIATLSVDAQGNWRGNVPDIDTGIYTLRVDAVDAAGEVTSRIETPFKREAPEVLAAASEGVSGPVSAVTVQTGDTLWAIARDRYGEGVLYVRVFEANRASIRDPDLIYPGQVFDLPTE